MKSGNRHLFRVFLAALPVLIQTGAPENAFWGSFLGAAIFLTSSVFFKITCPIFPKIFFRFAVLLLPLAAFQALFYWIQAPAVWSVSVFLLYDFKELESGPKGMFRIFWRAVFFVLTLCALAGVRYFAGRLGMTFFEHPSGVLMLLAVLWILLKGKPPASKPVRTRS